MLDNKTLSLLFGHVKIEIFLENWIRLLKYIFVIQFYFIILFKYIKFWFGIKYFYEKYSNINKFIYLNFFKIYYQKHENKTKFFKFIK